MKIETAVIGAGILAAIAWLISKAKAAPTESLTLVVDCIGSPEDACPPSSDLNFSGDYTLNDNPIDDTIHIFQFSSESDANNNIKGTWIKSGLTTNGHYNISGIAPSAAGEYYYKAYNEEESDLVELASV